MARRHSGPPPETALARWIGEGLARAGLAACVPSEAVALLARHLAEVYRWNARGNLTSIRDPRAGVAQHVLESLEGLQYLPGEVASLVDLGSGAGYPGLPLAVARPGLMVRLFESAGRKAAFLRAVVRDLGLADRVEIVDRRAERIEDLEPLPDVVVLRAFPAPLDWAAGARAAGVSIVMAWLGPADAERARTAPDRAEIRPLTSSGRGALAIWRG